MSEAHRKLRSPDVRQGCPLRRRAMSATPFDQRDGWIWYDGQLVPWKDAKLHVLSHGLHYGSCVFEGERAYGGEIFKGTEHSERLKGIRLDMAEYRRPDPATAPSNSKAAGLYMICTISKHKAERKGYADALMLDWQGRVAECTGANVFFIRDGVVHTPIADCFLSGITRQTVIDLARRRGFEVEERRIAPEELEGFNECFITGTAAEVTPVSEIGPYRFQPGNMTKVLMEDYAAEVRPKAKAA